VSFAAITICVASQRVFVVVVVVVYFVNDSVRKLLVQCLLFVLIRRQSIDRPKGPTFLTDKSEIASLARGHRQL
jgi:hypothetical protein